jgi:DNA-binding response OmpR family regulator
MNKICVIDDHPENVFILQDRLEKAGFEIITAYDGKTGLEKVRDELPDLVLLDVMMPGLSGFEVCRSITQDDLTKHIPVILLTALTSTEDLEDGLQAGAFDYIKKPFNRAELLARIKSALRFSETNKFLIEIEKVNTFAATVLTANHEIKQPLTLINLSTTAIRRELSKEELNLESIEKRVRFIESATKEIIAVLEKLTSIKKPVFTDYLNNLKMIDINTSLNKKL